MSYRLQPRILMLIGAALTLVGCSNLPWHRTQPSASAVSSTATSDQGSAVQCASLRAEIRSNQETERQAPTTSINEDIVAAAEGKADKRIDELRAQYDAMGCSAADLPPQHSRTAPLPPAPGGPTQ